MSIGRGAEIIGDGLLIPRVVAESRLEEPPFDGMGALVGPGSAANTLSIAVTAKRRGLTFILDQDYRPFTPGIVGMRLEDGDLVASQVTRDSGSPHQAEYRTKWPLDEAYGITVQRPQDAATEGLVELEFDSMRPFFDEERKRYEADRTVREHGIAVYGMLLLGESQFGRQTRNRFTEYHDGAVILTPTKLGQIAVSSVGQLGAMRYLLKEDVRRHSRGHHDFQVRDGKIYGETGNKISRFALAKLTSRHIPKVPLSAAA